MMNIFRRGSKSTVIPYQPTLSDERLVSDDATQSLLGTPQDDPVIELERKSWPRIPDSIPPSAWIIASIEMCERFAFFGLSGPLQNFLQKSHNDSLRHGAFGLGQANATRLNQLFAFWCYCTPIVGAVLADQYWGKYKTIKYSSVVYIIGLALLVLTALFLERTGKASVEGLIAALVLIGLGTGGIKTNVLSLIAEQRRVNKISLGTYRNGERVIIDPDLTIQRIFMISYMFINIGSLSPLATTEVEQHFGFWQAFLLPLVMFSAGFIVLLVSKNLYVIKPPEGSVILNAFRALWLAAKSGWILECAKQSFQAEQENPYPVHWDDVFIDELRRALIACKVFLFFPFYWVAYFQITTNLVSQAGTMETHSIPNDIMSNISTLCVVTFVPIFDRFVYPFFRKHDYAFPPITKITYGFILLSVAMAYSAFVQHLIYQSPPCFEQPLASDCREGNTPNQIHVAVQTPAYIFIAFSEILAVITGYEYAFTKAPLSMKSFVLALFLGTISLGAVLGIIISPLAVDPKVRIMYAGLAVVMLIDSLIFWVCLKKYNKIEMEMNALDVRDHQTASYENSHVR